MTHLSLPKDITEAQMLDVLAIIEKDLPLTDDQKTDLELDAMSLVVYGGDNSRLGYCRALHRLVNSKIY